MSNDRAESAEAVLQGLRDFENLYHCGECRAVFCFEEEDRKFVGRCPHCGPGTMWRVS